MAKVYNGYSNKQPNDKRFMMQVSTPILKERFVELFACLGHKGRCCEILGIVPRTLYHWLKFDEDFKEQVEEAQQLALMMLEDEAMRRAVYGVEEDVYFKGEVVGKKVLYSDGLLVKLLQANSSKYKDKGSLELTGADGKALEAKIIHVTSNIPLASSEEDILKLEQASQSNPSIQDADFEMLPKQSDDDENLDALTNDIPSL